MASARFPRRTLCSAAERAAAPGWRSRWDRLKNTKAGVWCRSLLSDYRDACRDVVQDAWARPLRASLMASLVGGGWLCVQLKPDYPSFEARLLEHSTRLGLLSPWTRSAASDGHVQSVAKLRNEGRLRYAGLGLLSVVYRADYDGAAALYEARCSSLAAPWRELPARLLDVGFAGRWWVLDSKMKDYDVNEDEFTHLPPHMRLTAVPGVQQVDENERLHRESWTPPSVDTTDSDSEEGQREDRQ
ncbi:mitochondrial import inner membrane translocase subunit Tim29 [Salarias fasciatus]|uniref:Translocase of inner mitochondrial membrane 29 n=1 Tax=Salarias fasciatus TaxID=181472 RepID=A0A672FGF2_SALFA|nr:mitochondrial import inner membrane translocase subunit Tim29 [Salarias fasciatus]